MGRMRKLTADERREEKERLHADLKAGCLSIAETVKRMRLITGLTQAEYATRFAQVSPQVLAQIEQGRANPTAETLNKIGHPFGLHIAFARRPRD